MDQDFADFVVVGILAVVGVVALFEEAGVAALDGWDGVGLDFVRNAKCVILVLSAACVLKKMLIYGISRIVAAVGFGRFWRCSLAAGVRGGLVSRRGRLATDRWFVWLCRP